jgi:hypothetical protein
MPTDPKLDLIHELLEELDCSVFQKEDDRQRVLDRQLYLMHRHKTEIHKQEEQRKPIIFDAGAELIKQNVFCF